MAYICYIGRLEDHAGGSLSVTVSGLVQSSSRTVCLSLTLPLSLSLILPRRKEASSFVFTSEVKSNIELPIASGACDSKMVETLIDLSFFMHGGGILMLIE